jgi:hypothetical protein
MATNYPGPYELRIKYDTQQTFGKHVQRLNIELASDPEPGPVTFSELTVLKNTGQAALDVAVENYLAEFRGHFNTATDIGPIELWKYTPGTFDSDFVTVYEPTIVAGTDGGAVVIAGQAIVTFYTEEGGVLKLNFMESVYSPGPDQSFPTNIGDINNLADWVAGPDGFLLGRDTSRVLARKGFFPGQNEKLWKKYNRLT